MRLFGGHNNNGCGCNEKNDCCEIFILLWLLSTCGCGFDFDCNTIIILLLLCNCFGGNDGCGCR